MTDREQLLALARARDTSILDSRRHEGAGRERLSKLGVVLDPDDSFELDWLVSRVERP